MRIPDFNPASPDGSMAAFPSGGRGKLVNWFVHMNETRRQHEPAEETPSRVCS
jgi:hypothetical protein